MKLKCKFTKADDERRLAFGFASVAEVDGQPVVDSQGDVISIDELETAAYNFVADSRTAGLMHEKTGVATLIESFVITPEKAEIFGLDNVPFGWFVGFKVTDDATWQRIKSGELGMFSIGGRANRKELNND